MINILSIRCSLAFAPYLLEALEAFLKNGIAPPRVVRQAANGLVIRADNALILRHQNSEASFGETYAKHYLATVRFRSEFYDIALKSDEVVIANLGTQLFLSHPQSQMLIDATYLPLLLTAFTQSQNTEETVTLPEWLTISGGDGRLLLSDGRNGRWVLLGSDHFQEFQRRYNLLSSAEEFAQPEKPPVILIKGIKVHLQSALKLARELEAFAETGQFIDYADITPSYSLMLMRANEGIKMSDGNLIVAINQREARKWAAILQSEIERLKLREIERGGITTVVADTEQGRWVLQMGDEVLITKDEGMKIREHNFVASTRLASKRDSDFLLILEKASGGCIALTQEEEKLLLAEK
jgi:hypothetical protein